LKHRPMGVGVRSAREMQREFRTDPRYVSGEGGEKKKGTDEGVEGKDLHDRSKRPFWGKEGPGELLLKNFIIAAG